MTAFAYLADFW